MCVALPGRVLKMNESEGTATVDFNGNIVEARSGLVDVKPGDRVLVHAGCILQKVTENEGDEMEDIFRELEEFAN